MGRRLVFLAATFAFGCAGLAAAQANRTAPQGGKGPATSGPQTGTFNGELKDDNGQFIIKYAAVVPKELPAQKTLALIVGLHGRGGNEKDQLGAISGLLSTCKLAKEYMVLGLKAKGESWADEDHEPIAKAIAWALKEYPMDARRVYIWGYSSGAFGVGRFAPRYQNLVAGGIMLAGGLWDPPKTEAAEQALQLYLINGEKDPTVTAQTAHEACERLKAAKYRFVYRELTGADHGLGGPGATPVRLDAIRFIHALRNRTLPLSDDERKLVEGFTAKLQDGKTAPSPASFSRLLDLSGAEVDPLLALACQSERREVRFAAAMLCQQRLYGKPALDALVGLLEDKDSQVRAAAAHALSLAANWQYAEAVEALCAFAKNSAKPDSERMNAAGQLGLTVPLQLFCVNRDGAVFETLKTLSEDKNPQVKLAAKLGLEGKLLPDGQGFKIK